MLLWASLLHSAYYKSNDLKIGSYISFIPDYWSRSNIYGGDEIDAENDPRETEEEDEEVKPETVSFVEANSENITTNLSEKVEEIGVQNKDGSEVLNSLRHASSILLDGTIEQGDKILNLSNSSNIITGSEALKSLRQQNSKANEVNDDGLVASYPRCSILSNAGMQSNDGQEGSNSSRRVSLQNGANIQNGNKEVLNPPSGSSIQNYAHIQNNEQDVSTLSRRSSRQSGGSVPNSSTGEILNSPLTSSPQNDENILNDNREAVINIPSDASLQSGLSKINSDSEIILYSTVSSGSQNEAIIQIINGEEIANSPHSSRLQINDSDQNKKGEDLILPGNSLNRPEILTESSPELASKYNPDTDNSRKESPESMNDKLSESIRSLCSDNEFICPTCLTRIRHVHFHEEMNQIHSISLESGHILAPLPRKDSKTDL